jgi:hypothetical protein
MIRVTAIDPNVSTSAVKLRVGVQTASPVVSAAVSYARATEYHVDLVVSAVGQVLASELDYILLNVGAYLDTSGRYRIITDIALVQDAVVVATGKALADATGVQDDSTFAVGKSIDEPTSVVDDLAAVLAWNRAFADLQPVDSTEYKGVALQNPIEAANRYVLEGYVYDGYVAVDSVFTDDSLGVMIQSYVSGDFFAEDYVGVTFGPY